MLSLEKELISMCKTENFDLATSGFIASGIKDGSELDSYLNRFGRLVSDIGSDERVGDATRGVNKAKAVFDWLWNSKPKRYNSTSKLTEVLNNQLSKGDGVGCCIGLTLFYNSICQRLNIDMGAVLTTILESRPVSPHMYSAINTGRGIVLIENTLKDGFDIKKGKGKIIDNQKLIQWFLYDQSNDCEKAGECRKAFSLEEVALRISPEPFNAHHLRMLAEDMGNLDMAVTSYEKILKEQPDSYCITMELAQSLEKKAELLEKGGKRIDLMRAIALYERAIKLKEKIGEDSLGAQCNLEGLYRETGNYTAASALSQRAIKKPKIGYCFRLITDCLDELEQELGKEG